MQTNGPKIKIKQKKKRIATFVKDEEEDATMKTWKTDDKTSADGQMINLLREQKQKK